MQLHLGWNNLTSYSVKLLLNLTFPVIQNLILDGNPYVDESALELMENKTYPKLFQLSFSSTSIGDEGIRHLITNNFPQLAVIALANCDITGAGVSALSQLKAPKLQNIDFSNNDLSVSDLFQLDIKNF